MKQVISCSRRTDIPAFYYGWLQKVLQEKTVTLTNGYSGKEYTIDLDPENVHSISLWSKDFSNVVKNPGLLEKYNLYFQYTITGRGGFSFEPNVPHYLQSFETVKQLADIYGGNAINWRFDPIFIEQKSDITLIEGSKKIVQGFEILADIAVKSGVKRCTISFMDFYDKVVKRLNSNDKCVYDINDMLKVNIAQQIIDIANEKGIELCLCAQKIKGDLTGHKDVGCVDGGILTELYGGKTTKAKDKSQRKLCTCVKSMDIGHYQSQSCLFKCLYCYANE